MISSLLKLLPQSYALASLLGPSGLRVVLYHHIAAAESDLVRGLGVTTPPDLLESHLEFYAKNYDIVSLDDVLDGKLPRRPLLITFDDAYRSVLDVAGPMLTSRSMPSVFFITAGCPGSGRLVLDNLLCYLANTVGLEKLETAITGLPAVCTTLAQLISQIVAGFTYVERMVLSESLTTAFRVDHAALLGEHRPYLDPDDFPKLAGVGMEVANHTLSHVHCRCLNDPETMIELTGPKMLLERYTGAPVRAFSYPYGSRVDATPIAHGIILKSHKLTFLVQAATNPRNRPVRTLYRVGLAGQETRRLFVELEILPRLRSIKNLLSPANRALQNQT